MKINTYDMKRSSRLLSALFIAWFSFTAIADAKVTLPSIFSDGMILQRNEPICVWGQADPGEHVKISWMGEDYLATADAQGSWKAELPEIAAGGPYTLTVNDIEVKDILIGDVFLCSGQSNMELPIRRVMDMFAEEVAEYENSSIRQFIVPKEFDFNQEREWMSPAAWTPCTSEHVMNFSAITYFFAKEIYEKTGVPVGLVNSSWGGTPVQAWISEAGLQDHPLYLNEKRLYEDDGFRKRLKDFENEEFFRWNTVLKDTDPGLNGQIPWYSQTFDDNSWPEVEMFSKEWGNNGLNPTAGSHWLRKEVNIPEKMAGKKAVIRLGCIVDSDEVYVNGTKVGSTGYQYPPRIYTIPEGVLKSGKNIVTVRIVSNGGQPSFVPEKPYKIICEGREFSLEGKWKYHLGAPMPKAPAMMFFCYKPVCLYNAMIHPLKNLRFSAVLWYQGESNVDRRNEYAELLGIMMKDWRKTFDAPQMPFYIVELADFLHKDDLAGRQAWAEMREQQARAAKLDVNARLIRNSDLGEWNDIHPLDKKTIGKRAAKEALNDIKKKK